MSQAWWHTRLILALGKQRQQAECEFEGGLVYIVSSGAAETTERKGGKKGGRVREKKRERDLVSDSKHITNKTGYSLIQFSKYLLSLL